MRGSRDPHGPAPLTAYVNTHEAHMGKLVAEGVVLWNTLNWHRAPRARMLVGHLGLSGGIAIGVNKTLSLFTIGRTLHVQTRLYSYNASIQGMSGLFRYDNAHTHPGHPDAHHVHRWNVDTRTEIKPPEWVGVNGWPLLRDVAREAHEFFLTEGSRLGLRSDAPDPARCRLSDLLGTDD